MGELRGAMPDAECPRCGATSPPPASRLATCARCGLVFPPHEIEHRLPPPPPLPAPPARVAVRRDEGRIIVRWPLARWPAAFAIAAALGTSWPMIAFASTVFWWVAVPLALAVAVFAYLALVALVSSHVVVIDRDAVRYRIGPLPFRARPVIARRDTVAVELGAGASWFDGVPAVQLRRANGSARRLVSSRDRPPLHYVAELVAAQLAVPLDEH